MLQQNANPIVYILEMHSIISDDQIIRIKKYLPPERIARAERYRRKKDHDACVAAFFLLIYGLKAIGIKSVPQIGFGKYGKPFFPDVDINFNISHCDKAVCCGISKDNIGVDIQDSITDFEGILRYSMTDKEAQFIHSSADQSSAFTRQWCIKESFLKFNGTGLNYPLDKLEILNSRNSFTYSNCLFTVSPSSDYVVCSCTSGLTPIFIKKDLSEYLL